VNVLRGWLGRLLLGTVGLALVAYLVRGAGPERVAHVLVQAGPWLPAIVALELAQMLSDVVALRALLPAERRDVPTIAWVRSSAVAYAMMILLPAGRAAGEVTRATLIAKHVAVPRVAIASTQLQAAYLIGIAMASAGAGVGVACGFGVRTLLVTLLAVNVAITSVTAVVLIGALADARVWRWLEKLRRKLTRDSAPPGVDTTRRPIRWQAIAACCGGRSAQLVQYGVILTAIGGAPTVQGALTAHGIHLVGATIGDVLPNGLGIIDGVYRAFASVLGLGAAPERALSIAFIAHAVQLSLAGVCVVVASIVGHAERPTIQRATPSGVTSK
jgi:lysylphosphatidylglycerol synthase-like protein